MSNKEGVESSAKAVKSLLRYIKLLENNAGNVISNLPAFASNKNLDLREIEQGKVVLHYILSSLRGTALKEEEVDKKED